MTAAEEPFIKSVLQQRGNIITTVGVLLGNIGQFRDRLRRQVVHSYRPGRYVTIEVRDPKRRLVSAARAACYKSLLREAHVTGPRRLPLHGRVPPMGHVNPLACRARSQCPLTNPSQQESLDREGHHDNRDDEGDREGGYCIPALRFPSPMPGTLHPITPAFRFFLADAENLYLLQIARRHGECLRDFASAFRPPRFPQQEANAPTIMPQTVPADIFAASAIDGSETP